jgi:YD repeat-containing protein
MSSPRTPRPFYLLSRRKEGNLTSRIKRSYNSHIDFQYDDRNRPIQTLYADGGFSRVLLDGAGRTVAASAPLGEVSGYALDPTATTYSSHELARVPGYGRAARPGGDREREGAGSGEPRLRGLCF